LQEKKRQGLRPAEIVILALTACVLCFVLGWFLRGAVMVRPVTQGLELLPPRRAQIEPIALPEPTEGEPAPVIVNINTADIYLIMTLPGIGEKRAADIIAHREANGPFTIPEELTEVKGIGDAMFAAMEHLVTVD